MRTKLVVVFCLVFGACPLFSCGFCDGDKEAAVYSFENLELAGKIHGTYAVAAVEGFVDSTQEKALKAALGHIGGIQGAILVSFEQKTVSFVFDRSVTNETIENAFSKEMQGMKLRFIKSELFP